MVVWASSPSITIHTTVEPSSSIIPHRGVEGWLVHRISHYHSKTCGETKVRYPQLTDNAVPAWEEINDHIRNELPKKSYGRKSNATDEFYYTFSLDVLDITPSFVSMILDDDSFCGGAHPNHGRRGYVYDASTGKRMLIEKELRGSDYQKGQNDLDFEKYEAFQKRFSNFLAPRLKRHFDRCMEGGDELPGNAPWDHNVVEELIHFEFNFALKEHALVVMGVPAHVIDVCSFTVTIPYAAIASFIRPNSILHTWLK